MASMSETLTERRGGVPTYVWLLGGVGVLVVIMFLRNKKAAAASQAAASQSGGALQTNVLSPEAAASLAQGAAPMGFSGGNVYNNIATSTGSTTPGSSTPAPFSGDPGFFYKLGSSQLYATITDTQGNQYSFDPLEINGQEVTWQQFASKVAPIAKAMGYTLSPPTGDFTLDEQKTGIGPQLLPFGQTWLNGHSVDASGNIVNTPSPNPVPVTASGYGGAPALSATPPYTLTNTTSGNKSGS